MDIVSIKELCKPNYNSVSSPIDWFSKLLSCWLIKCVNSFLIGWFCKRKLLFTLLICKLSFNWLIDSVNSLWIGRFCKLTSDLLFWSIGYLLIGQLILWTLVLIGQFCMLTSDLLFWSIGYLLIGQLILWTMFWLVSSVCSLLICCFDL